MSAAILFWALLLAQSMLAAAMACATFRIIRGPRAQDRILALDTLYVCAMLLFITMDIGTTTRLFFELALVIGLLGFVTTVGLARFLLRGEVIE